MTARKLPRTPSLRFHKGSGQGFVITCDLGANGYRLPTEAEWEYAARSRGKKCKYAWGDDEPYIDGRPAGNTKDEAAKREWDVEKIWAGYDDGYACTAPAGSSSPPTSLASTT